MKASTILTSVFLGIWVSLAVGVWSAGINTQPATPVAVPYCAGPTAASQVRAGFYIPLFYVAASSTYPTTVTWSDGTHYYAQSQVVVNTGGVSSVVPSNCAWMSQ